jgi:hypothetical protein
MRSKKIGSSDLLDIMVYPLVGPFDVELFTQHMIHRTAHMFASEGGKVLESVFVAVTGVDPETNEPPMTLTVIVPKWQIATRDEVYVDVREFLVRSQGIAVCLATEVQGSVVVAIEAKRSETKSRHRRSYSAMIVNIGSGGDRVLGSWGPTIVGVNSVPLLPAEPMDLA